MILSPITGTSMPEGTDPPAGHSQMTSLVGNLERYVVGRFATTAARDIAIPVPTDGMIAVVLADVWLRVAGAWVLLATTGPVRVGCELAHTASQNYTAANWTDTLFNSEIFDSHAFHSTVSNTNRITIPAGQAGVYSVSYHHEGLSVNWQMKISRNGLSMNRIGVGSTIDTVNWTGYCAVADYLTFAIYLGASPWTAPAGSASYGADAPPTPGVICYRVA